MAACMGYLAARARQLVGRPGRPPLVFALGRLAGGGHLLSFVYHDAVADSWSAALLWQELLADYDRAVHRRPLVRGLRPGPDTAGAPWWPPGRAGCGGGGRVGPSGCAVFPPPWT